MYRKALSKKRARSAKYDNSGSGLSKQSTGTKNTHVIDYRSKSAYGTILRNPFVQNPDVRIPDGLALIPTSTFDVHYEFDVATNASGVAGFCLGLTAKPQLWRLGAGATATNFIWDNDSGGKIIHNNPSAAGNRFNLTGVGNITNNGVIPSESFWGAVDTAYRGWRLVAAGTKTEFIGNDANNQGVIQGLHIKGGTIASHVPNRFYPEINDMVGTVNTQPLYTEATTYVTHISDWAGARMVGTQSLPSNVIMTGTPTALTTSDGTNTDILLGLNATSPTNLAGTYPDLLQLNTVDAIRLAHGSVTKPAKDGLKLIYTPGCLSDMEYKRPNSSALRTANEGNTGKYAMWDYISNTDAVPALTAYSEFDEELVTGPFKKFFQIGDSGNGALLCIITGGAPGVTSHKVRVSLHYEALPEPSMNLNDGGKVAAPHQQSIYDAWLLSSKGSG